MRTLLIVFPEPSSRWGGERLRKLCEPLSAHGWRPVFLATTERAAQQMHGVVSQHDWLAGHHVVRAPDASPYVAGAAVRRLLGKRRTAAAGLEVSSPGGAAEPSRRSIALRILDRVWLPDAYAGWNPFAVAAGVRLARRVQPAAIFSTYPPASSHTVALALHRLTGIAWVADFRDPWARADEQTYPTAAPTVAAVLERAVLRHATAVTAVGPTLAGILRERTGTPVHVLPQGFDPLDLREAAHASGDVLDVVHMGTLSRWPSDPGPLVRAAARLESEGIHVHVTQVGQVFDVDEAVAAGVEAGVLTLEDPVGRDEALRRIAAADVAVVIRTEPGRLWMTTKVWDYLAARRPILVIADPESDVAQLVTSARAGVTAPYWDEVTIAERLRDLHARKQRGDLPWSPDASLDDYAAPAVAERFVRILDDLSR